MKRILLLVASIQFSLFASAQSCNSLRYQDTIFHTVDTIGNVYFGTATPYGVLAQPQDLYLDIYQPAGDTLSKRPLIVFQFGGGFTIGWRSEPDIPQFCQYFAKCGYVVASIDYRIGLNPLDTNSTVRAFYRGVQDERAAIRFLSQRAQQYRIDTNYLILTGTSAGCFCAFANAFMTDSDRPASTFGTALEPDDMGCMDCSGNNDLGLFIPHIKAIVNCWGAMLDTSYIEAGENTPVISFHGDQDVLVPYVYGYPFSVPVFPRVYGSQPIHERLTNVGTLNVLHPLVGYGHEPELLAPQVNDTIYNYARPFLFELLKPVTPDITGDTMLCAGMTASYSVVSTAGSTYCWNITGDGTIVADNGNAITVLWTDTGLVSVSVREMNYIMAVGEERTFQTKVIPHAVSNFSSVANVLDVSFTNLSTNAQNYEWDLGDGTVLNDQLPVINYQYQNPGTYDVSLVAANNFCADTFSASFSIDTCPVADITFSLTGHNAFFYSPVTNTVSYFWNFGDGDSAAVNTPNVFHQYSQNGDYTIVLQVENQSGCKEIDTLTIRVEVLSSVDKIYDDVSVSCDGINLCTLSVTGKATVQVYDLSGRKIEEEIFVDHIQLNTSNYPTGVYFIKVLNGENVFVKKIIRE